MAIFGSKNIVMAQGVCYYIKGLNFGLIFGFYSHYLALEDNTRGLGAGISRPLICHFFSTEIFSAQIFFHIDLEQKWPKIP